MDFTVIVVTHNRAAILRETLDAIARLEYPGPWEAVVVDNNSRDDTREVVTSAAAGFPVPLRYLYVPQPGKYWALNAGIEAADGRFIAATDDDAYPEPQWLQRAAAGFDQYGCAFVGGPVYPVWRGSPPAWVKPDDPVCGKVLGLQNHGAEPREYGVDGISWPLGVNVAYRREAFALAGLFDGRLGRVAGTLRNQSQREWHLRGRAAGLRGMYLPGMVVHHSVEAHRLTPGYFRRWFYWHGISRAILSRTSGRHVLEPESTATHAGERHVLGVPLCVFRQAVRSGLSAGRRRLTGRSADAVEHELMVCFAAGAIRQFLKDRHRTVPPPHRPVNVPRTTA